MSKIYTISLTSSSHWLSFCFPLFETFTQIILKPLLHLLLFFFFYHLYYLQLPSHFTTIAKWGRKLCSSQVVLFSSLLSYIKIFCISLVQLTLLKVYSLFPPLFFYSFVAYFMYWEWFGLRFIIFSKLETSDKKIVCKVKSLYVYVFFY